VTVHVISVGVGINDALQRRTAFASLPDLAPAVLRAKPHTVLSRSVGGDDTGAADALLTGWFGDPCGPVTAPGWPGGALPDLVDVVRPDLWPTSVSAELDTFHRATGTRTLPPRDTAVLLTTDTVTGMTAALWNAIALTAATPSRVRYASHPQALDPPDDDRPPLGGSAVIVRIPRLHARTETDLCAAMRNLGTVGRALLRPPGSAPAEDFRFYLSGGFKAAIPYLIGLAEGLKSVRELTGSVKAYILHEDTGGAPIPLPLRRLNPDWVHRELDGFDDAGATRTRPDGDFLAGYAYDGAATGPWLLTPFGHGLRELFGLAPAAILGR